MGHRHSGGEWTAIEASHGSVATERNTATAHRGARVTQGAPALSSHPAAVRGRRRSLALSCPKLPAIGPALPPVIPGAVDTHARNGADTLSNSSANMETCR